MSPWQPIARAHLRKRWDQRIAPGVIAQEITDMFGDGRIYTASMVSHYAVTLKLGQRRPIKTHINLSTTNPPLEPNSPRPARIRKLRAESGLSVQQVAERMCCSEHSIKRWESEQVTISKWRVIALAAALGVTRQVLLG